MFVCEVGASSGLPQGTAHTGYPPGAVRTLQSSKTDVQPWNFSDCRHWAPVGVSCLTSLWKTRFNYETTRPNCRSPTSGPMPHAGRSGTRKGSNRQNERQRVINSQDHTDEKKRRHQHMAKMKSHFASASNRDTTSDFNLESAPALFLSIFTLSIAR